MMLAHLALSFLALCAPLQSSTDDGELPRRLEEALADCEQRNPDAHEQLQRLLLENREQALRTLAQHADYLDELAKASRDDPRQHELLLQQEALAKKAHELVKRYRQLRHAEPLGDAEPVVDALRDVLNRWFETRQELREVQYRKRIAQLESEESRTTRARADGSQAVGDWMARLAAGGTEIDRLTGSNLPVEMLAPGFISAIMARDRYAGARVARLERQDPARFRHELLELATDDRELVIEARRRTPDDEFAAFERFRETVRAARNDLAAPRDSDLLDARLRELVAAELELATLRAKRVRRELEHMEADLGFRRERAEVIVDLQLARLLGKEDRYSW